MQEMKNIVVPVDFDSHTEKITSFAAFMADKLSAKLHFINVCLPFGAYGGFEHISLNNAKEELLSYSEQKMANLITDYPGSDGKVVSGEVVDEIINFVKENNADLLIIGTHGSKGLEKILLGSVAERVIKRSPCPTLSFNPYK